MSDQDPIQFGTFELEDEKYVVWLDRATAVFYIRSKGIEKMLHRAASYGELIDKVEKAAREKRKKAVRVSLPVTVLDVQRAAFNVTLTGLLKARGSYGDDKVLCSGGAKVVRSQRAFGGVHYAEPPTRLATNEHAYKQFTEAELTEYHDLVGKEKDAMRATREFLQKRELRERVGKLVSQAQAARVTGATDGQK